MADIELRNKTNFDFIDISDEIYREYEFFQDNHTYYLKIKNPQFLAVSKSGGHRVIDINETCFYITPKWHFITWKVKEGHPHFIK